LEAFSLLASPPLPPLGPFFPAFMGMMYGAKSVAFSVVGGMISSERQVEKEHQQSQNGYMGKRTTAGNFLDEFDTRHNRRRTGSASPHLGSAVWANLTTDCCEDGLTCLSGCFRGFVCFVGSSSDITLQLV